MRRSNVYTQTVLGMCGHVCVAWPLIVPFPSDTPEVICEECTRESLRLDPTVELSVWVRTVEEKKPAKKTSPKKARVKKVTCSLCQKTGHGYMECPLITEPIL